MSLRHVYTSSDVVHICALFVSNSVIIMCCVGTECQEAGKMDDKVASGYQFRHRRILSNASADGTECPALSQLRRCHTDWGDACSRWEVQPLLDTCHLADNATCGLGYHELVFRCRRYDGVRVTLHYYFFFVQKKSEPPAQLFAYYIANVSVRFESK